MDVSGLEDRAARVFWERIVGPLMTGEKVFMLRGDAHEQLSGAASQLQSVRFSVADEARDIVVFSRRRRSR